MAGETRILGDWLSRLRYDDIPTRCREVLKLALMDSLGCALAGAAAPWSQLITGWVAAQGGRPDARLWVHGGSVPAHAVALANGVAIHAWCFDDTHPTKTHPGSVVVAAVAALAERRATEGEAVSGREFLTALAAGYEAMIRTAQAVGPSAARLRGWQITGIAGPFGAAAGAARLLGLGPVETVSALGLAGTQASGLYAFTADGADSERFHPGRAAQAGVVAAELAALGLKGPGLVLEAIDGGFCGTVSDGGDPARAIAGLGERFFSHEMSFKPYPVCASLVATIDALRALKAEHGFDAAAVADVEVGISHVVEVQCGWEYEPLGVLQAQMSLQYCVAAALQSDFLTFSDFADSQLAATEKLALIRRVRGVVDPDIDRLYPGQMASRVAVTLRDGHRLTARVDDPKGAEANPMSSAEIRHKFHGQADPWLGRRLSAELAEAILDLEHIADVSTILAPLSQKDVRP